MLSRDAARPDPDTAPLLEKGVAQRTNFSALKVKAAKCRKKIVTLGLHLGFAPVCCFVKKTKNLHDLYTLTDSGQQILTKGVVVCILQLVC